MLYDLIITLNPFILLAISVLFAWCSTLSATLFAKVTMPNKNELYLGLIIKQLFGALILTVLFGVKLPSVNTVLIGSLFGICIALSVLMQQRALCCGPMTICVMVASSGAMVLNAVFGAVFWSEHLSVFKYIGIAGMATMMYLVIGKGSSDVKAEKKYYVFTVLATVFSVTLGFVQKAQQNSEYKSEIGCFLTVAFIVSAMILALSMLLTDKKSEKIRPKCIFGAKSLSYLLLGGLSYSAIHTLNLYLAGALDSAVFFPIANGAPMILSIIAAILLFREYPTKKQIIGIIMGIASIVVLGEIWK